MKQDGDVWNVLMDRAPTLLDASLFAYTHLIMTLPMVDDRLKRILKKYDNLIRRNDSIRTKYDTPRSGD